MRSRFCLWLTAASCVVLAAGCSGASIKSTGARPVTYQQAGEKAKEGEEGQTKPLTEGDLQQDLLRFDGRFAAQVREALGPLTTSPDEKVREEAMQQTLAYRSNSMDIAIGAFPPVNLLDMVAFIELSRMAAKDQLIPRYFGKQGRPLQVAFDQSSKEIWGIASKYLNENQRAILMQLILEYRKENPNQMYVEGVRLSEFAEMSGRRGEKTEVSGLIGSMQGALKEADAMRLMGERTLYYTQRAPFLFRAHAQIALRGLIKDVTLATSKAAAATEQTTLKQLSHLLDQLKSLGSPLLRQLFLGQLALIVILVALLFVAAVIARVFSSYVSYRILEKRRRRSKAPPSNGREEAA